MQIIIDTNADSHNDMRAAAAFLLHLVGDLGKEELTPSEPTIAVMAPAANTAAVLAAANITPNAPIIAAAGTASNVPPPPPPAVPAPPASVPTGTNDDDGDDDTPVIEHTSTGPVPPPAPSNVVQGNFPSPPPPPPTSVASNAGASAASATPASTTMPTTVVSAATEFDSAGMPYDARIHQKGKGKKKDNTWKLIKGIDTNIVQAVVAELAARKGAAAPVSLPYAANDPNRGANTVPVPPVPPVTPVAGVPAPPVAPSMPVPPSAPAGVMGAGNPYRALIDKITEATKAGTLTPAKVAAVCQLHGAPSLMQLNSMPHLIADVNSSIDAAILGL